jgi:hypothetical protein
MGPAVQSLKGGCIDERGATLSKKSLLRTIAILLVVGIGVLAVTECRPGTATAFNFWRVSEGMSQADVESILGPGVELNPGETAGKSGATERLIVPGQPAADVDSTRRWVASDLSGKYLLLGFKDGRVRFKHVSALGR